MRFLVPLALVSQSRFLKASALGLTIGLAIGRAKSIGKEVAVS